MFNQRAAQAYAKVGIETGVAAASPHRLILMLYDGAIGALADARNHLAAGRIGPKGEAISKAIAIIDEGLKASVDTKRGGTIAAHLLELYDYMNRRLLMASMRNDARGLEEVASLLRELREAWAAMPPPVATAEYVAA